MPTCEVCGKLVSQIFSTTFKIGNVKISKNSCQKCRSKKDEVKVIS
jgi:C4-type Zn-finger protein